MSVCFWIFQTKIRPHHYQLLRPYTIWRGKQLVTTDSRIGRDGELEVFIPAGNAILGHDQNEVNAFINEYWIDQKTTTLNDYLKCVKTGVCYPPHYQLENEKYLKTRNPFYGWLPVTYVSWQEAEGYCEYYGGHLPTEAQWEKSARGTTGRIYLWNGGEENKDYRMVNIDQFYTTLVPSGWLIKGASPFGILDTAGNVREWVLDAYISSDAPIDLNNWSEILKKASAMPDGILKGGSYLDDLAHARPYYRDSHAHFSSGITRGFRCAFEY